MVNGRGYLTSPPRSRMNPTGKGGGGSRQYAYVPGASLLIVACICVIFYFVFPVSQGQRLLKQAMGACHSRAPGGRPSWVKSDGGNLGHDVPGGKWRVDGAPSLYFVVFGESAWEGGVGSAPTLCLKTSWAGEGRRCPIPCLPPAAFQPTVHIISVHRHVRPFLQVGEIFGPGCLKILR